MRNILTILAALLVLGACKSTKTNDAMKGGIENTQWVLVELMGKPVTNPGPSGKVMFLNLDKASKRISAYAGCNNLMGGYELMDGNRIKFSNVASTMMACPDMHLEDELKNVLGMADNYAILDGKLSLNKARMAPLARFDAKK
jgi:heat shock protein HslJ